MSRDLAAVIDHPNVRRYLEAIARAEGTAKHADPYRVAFGGGRIAELTWHPGTVHRFRQSDGRENTTTAAGKYQFLARTWHDVATRLGLTDFSPRSQDLGALELMRRSGSLDDVLRGDYASAIRKDGRTWASLPSSPYPQPKRSDTFIAQALGAPRTTSRNSLSPITPTHVPPIPLPAWLPTPPAAMSVAAPPPMLPAYAPQSPPPVPSPDVPYAIEADLRQLRRQP